jgi:ATP-dependent RNA helicase HrpB
LMEALPIDPLLPGVVSSLQSGCNVILTAAPGAGKTTRVPRAVYDSCWDKRGEVLVLEPRRLAARLAAVRVAEEMGQDVGGTVGYSIRFESVDSPRTRIRYVTEGVFPRRIADDPLLHGVDVVILDEFHERHIATDLALAFLRRLQLNERPELRLLVMSATLEPGPVAAFLGDARVFAGSETPFEVTIENEARADSRPLHEKIASTVSRALQRETSGNILVFLPGMAEIRRAAESLSSLSAKGSIELCVLHGDMPTGEQLQPFSPSGKQKVILATNVAETSITIPGVTVVIDSGLARRAGFSPWSGLPVTQVAKVSQASARQRAGRAGRTGSGLVLRLYTRHDFETRPPFEVPEIRRADLAGPVLALHGAGVVDVRGFGWFEKPREAAIESAETLLAKLGALDPGGRITSTGKRMLHFPVHPRLARLLLEGENAGLRREVALVAALVSERDIRLEARSRLSNPGRQRNAAVSESDLLEMRDRFREAEAAGFRSSRVAQLGLDPRAVESVERAARQIEKSLSPGPPTHPGDADTALLESVLMAFPDRVAARRAPGSDDFLLAGGGAARQSPASVVRNATLVAAVDAEERSGMPGEGRQSAVLLRLVSEIRREWLETRFPGEITRENCLAWNDRAGRVDEIARTRFGQIILEEKTRTASPSEEASRMLAEAALAVIESVFGDYDRAREIHARLSLLARYSLAEAPQEQGGDMRTIVAEACAGKRSLRELADISLAECVLRRLKAQERSFLERETPERIELSGRKVRVHYAEGSEPWIEARIQDFFGLYSTPAICRGRQLLQLRLLAPNGRPAQVTQDLNGFWTNHYPGIRRELMRRYPKHRWPDPATLLQRGKKPAR